jgi:hypothetical protein
MPSMPFSTFQIFNHLTDFNKKKVSKFVPVYAMKAYGGAEV